MGNTNGQKKLEEYLREAAGIFRFPETMNVKTAFHHLIARGVYTSEEIEKINRCLSKIKSRLCSY